MTFHFPDAFEHRMKNALGNDWNDFAKAHQDKPPVSIRYNPLKPLERELLPPISWTSHGKYLAERPVFTLDPALHAGAYYVQEASSMFLEQAFRQSVPGDQSLRVLDLCAAPGGKSTHLLSLMNADSLLVSNEVIRSRVNILSENIQKWGYPNVVVTNNDAADFSKLNGAFDVIVIDAPCSGEGLFRKDPNAMTEWSEHNVELCSQRQQRIISDVWPALKQNGILIYSTCTYNTFENEDNLKWLQQNHSVDFIRLNNVSHWGIDEVVEGNAYGYRFYPHRTNGEGFFLSVVRKTEDESSLVIKGSKNNFTSPSKKTTEIINNWVTLEDKTFILRNDLVQFLPSAHTGFINLLTQHFRVAYAGTFVAVMKHEKLIPEHSLALSIYLNQEQFYKVPLNLNEALQYLKKELSIQPDHRGFGLATYDRLGLGWMNILQGRINNLYPAEWRIRMQL